MNKYQKTWKQLKNKFTITPPSQKFAKNKKDWEVGQKNMKLKDQKNKCFHTNEYKYTDEDGDLHCEKCEAELKR